MKKLLGLLGAAGLVATTGSAVVACSPAATDGIKLSASTADLAIGGSTVIKITNFADLKAPKAVSATPATASAVLSATGEILIVGLVAGTVNVTVSATDQEDAVIAVTVAAPSATITTDAEATLSLAPAGTSEVTISAPESATGVTVVSSDAKVATVSAIASSKFTITGVAAGTTLVTLRLAKAADVTIGVTVAAAEKVALSNHVPTTTLVITEVKNAEEYLTDVKAVEANANLVVADVDVELTTIPAAAVADPETAAVNGVLKITVKSTSTTYIAEGIVNIALNWTA